MDEEKKNIILAALKRAFDTHPQAWRDYNTLGAIVLDCAELVQDKSAALRLSKGFTTSCRAIEEVLRKEKQPDLLKDFHTMTDILDQVRELWITAPRQIDGVIAITSEFLLAMEEIEESTEQGPLNGSTMETAALKIILELKEQNILMKRGIGEALMMLTKRHHHPFLNYEDKNITGLLNEIGRLVEDLNKSNRPEQPEEDPI